MRNFKSFFKYLIEGPEQKANTLANKLKLPIASDEMQSYLVAEKGGKFKNTPYNDISKITSLEILKNILKEYGTVKSKSQEKKELKILKPDDADLIEGTDQATVYRPETYNGSAALTMLGDAQREELNKGKTPGSPDYMIKAKWCTGADSNEGVKSFNDTIKWRPMVTFWIIVMNDGSDRWGVQININETMKWWDVMNKEHSDSGYINKILQRTGLSMSLFTDEYQRLQDECEDQQTTYRNILRSIVYTRKEWNDMLRDYGQQAVDFVKNIQGLSQEDIDNLND